MGYVDLHSHVLPRVDDGPPDLVQSLAMLRGLASLGFEEICATPHQRAGLFLPDSEAIAAVVTEVREALVTAGLPLTVRVGAENYWDEVFFQRFRDDAIPTYAIGPGGSHARPFLFEIPGAEIPPRLEELLFGFARRGLLPVLAHPERTLLADDIDRCRELARRCALVADLGALGGKHGWRPDRRARRLAEAGLIHAAASDAHRTDDVAEAAAGLRWIEKHLGADGVRRLLDENPRRILGGDLPEA
jgi:protein-tyrosine phosphatase